MNHRSPDSSHAAARLGRATLDHLHGLWGRWWPVPVVLPAAYVAYVTSRGDLRAEHVGVLGLGVVLAYLNSRTKRFFAAVVPYLVVAVGYDAIRYLRPLFVEPGDVLGCGLRSAELALFRVAPDMTYQDWFTAHHHPALDLIFAVPYFAFVYVVLVYAGYLYFADRPRMRHFLWAYAVANLIAFVVWLTAPAAPPWYLREHGCSIVLETSGSAAALIRVDALVGVPYFEQFYSRVASVFGALPSLHCAYPLIGLLTARRVATRVTWPLHVLYTALMAVAAVYLDHHWVLDVLAGWLTAIAAVWLSGWALRRWAPAGDHVDGKEALAT